MAGDYGKIECVNNFMCIRWSFGFIVDYSYKICDKVYYIAWSLLRFIMLFSHYYLGRAYHKYEGTLGSSGRGTSKASANRRSPVGYHDMTRMRLVELIGRTIGTKISIQQTIIMSSDITDGICFPTTWGTAVATDPPL